MASLEITGISKSFGSTTVLNDVSLSIGSGEFFFILGPSGCGKSTLLRLIAGLDRQSAGTISVNGAAVDSVPAHKRGIGLVFQNYALWPHMTVGQNIAFGLDTQGRPQAEVAVRSREALALVRMEGLEDRFPHEISGGQQQRVALARALAVRPEIILLDEPLSNLDARLRDEIRAELQALHEQLKITMIYVTHDQEDALTLATKIALFRAGEIEQVGTPRQLYERPRTAYAAEFLGGANLIPCVTPCPRPGAGDHPVESVNLTGALAEKTLFAFASEFHANKNTYICVRPENVGISASPRGGEGELWALVRRVMYKGPHLDIELLLDEGTIIVARVPSLSDCGEVSVGDRVTVSWAPKAATIVTR